MIRSCRVVFSNCPSSSARQPEWPSRAYLHNVNVLIMKKKEDLQEQNFLKIFVTHSDDDCICSVLLCEHVPTWPKFNV